MGTKREMDDIQAFELHICHFDEASWKHSNAVSRSGSNEKSGEKSVTINSRFHNYFPKPPIKMSPVITSLLMLEKWIADKNLRKYILFTVENKIS